MSLVYNWKRFWCPRSGRINLTGFGYLYDPDTDFGHYLNPDLVTFNAIAHLPCLALLGEPGIGKSFAIEAEQKIIDAKIKEEGSQILRLNLREYSSEDRLVRRFFESPTFNAWIQGQHRLYVFLDSLDECLLRINTLAALLVGELSNYSNHVERLYLRITCRTADWPNSLEQGLRKIWGKEAVGVYELAPLLRVDIASAAQTKGLDENNFLQAIEQQEVVPLAIKPITLKFLLNTYCNNGSLPTQQTELYLKGCRLLCEETNEYRRDARLTGNFTADQRMVVAARIAAVTVFCNRYAVWMDIDQGEVPPEDVVIRELVGGIEFVQGDQFSVTKDAVREVLSTALFSSRGSHRMGWAHQTYAEFLAAWYLQHRQLTLEQMMSLIVHPGDPDGKLVPQLQETAAWLSSINQKVFQEVMKTNPDILLNSSVATADDTVKANLVESLLKLYDEEKLLYEPRYGAYIHLKHQNLAAQLQPYIYDATKNETARYVAIEIAQQCEVKLLQGDLVNIALAPEQPYWVRVNAADTICLIGDEETKARLKPLATGKAGDDIENELKGYGLRAVWPNHITAAELFNILIQPTNKATGGTYQNFVAKDIGRQIQLDDLPIALKWVEQQPLRRDLRYPFNELADTILLKTCEHLDVPYILKAFANIVYYRLKNYDQITDKRIYNENEYSCEDILIQDDNKRHQILETIVIIFSQSEAEIIGVLSYNFPGINQDFLWILEKLKQSSSEANQLAWAKLIWRLFKRYDPEQVNAILTVSEQIPILKAEFSKLIEPIKLTSQRAIEERADYLQDLKNQERNKNQQLLDPPPKERIIKYLDQFESGNINSWTQICDDITLMPDSIYYEDRLLFTPNITMLPGWKEAESLTKTRIIGAAKVYIDKADPKTLQWLGTNKFYYSTLAGYKALCLILQEEPEYICAIPDDIWEKWTAVILDYPKTGNPKDEEIRQELVKIAYRVAPDEVINTLMILIDKENQDNGSISIHHTLEKCWNQRLASAIFSKVKNHQLKPENLGNLLDALISHNFDEAKTFAESLISLPIPENADERAKVIAVAKALMISAKDAGWSVVWTAIQQDPDFGRELIESVSYSFEYTDSLEQRLKEEYIADLYIFLVQEYPLIEKSKQDHSQTEELTSIEDRTIRPEDAVTTWRNNIPQRLKNRGTPEACEAIRRIMRELPDQKDKLERFLLETEALTLRNTWISPQPSIIIELAKSSYSKEVQSLVNYGIIQNFKDSTVHGSVQALQGNHNQQSIENANIVSQDKLGNTSVKEHILCSNCSHVNPNSCKFCSQCGQKLISPI